MKQILAVRRVFRMLGISMRQTLILIALVCMYAALEGFGIGLLLPVMEYVEQGGMPDVTSSSALGIISHAAGVVGIPLTLGTLLIFSFMPIIARQGVYYLNTWYSSSVQNHSIQRMRAEAFAGLVDADFAFVENHDQGELLGYLTGQVAAAGAALMSFVSLMSSSVLITVYVVLLLALSPPLTAIAVAAIGLISVLIRRILTDSKEEGRNLQLLTQESYMQLRELVGALRLIKMRAQEPREKDRVNTISRGVADAQVHIDLGRAKIEVVVDPSLMLGVFLVVFVGVRSFGMTLASLGLFMFILLRLNAKAKEFNLQRQQLSVYVISLDYIDRMRRETAAARTVLDGRRNFKGLEGAIQFESVSFSYSPEEPDVLSDVSLTVPAGSLTALVGRSGAGKSTLADLIPRLRVPTEGRVLMDGVDIAEFELASLRRQIGFMSQDSVMFNDTVLANLTYGLERDPSDDEITTALEDSYSRGFINQLPNGLQTVVGDQGTRLSGGQRQRLALARVLLQKPTILILDEPTSALDSESENYIQAALDRMLGHTTLVVIAHRLSTVRKADQIILLEDGRLVERGTHEELLAAQGHYGALFEAQMGVARQPGVI